jgi:hypothetical protein
VEYDEPDRTGNAALGQFAARRGGARRRFVAGADYLWARFIFFALRGLTVDALDCLNRLVFLIFTRLARCTAGFLAACINPVAPQLKTRASANVRSRILVLLRT